MPNVTLKRESDQALHFAHTHLAGWLFALVGAGMATAGAMRLDGPGYWLVVFVGGFFAIIGFGAAMWRYEIHIDLTSRSYRGRRGFWPSTRKFGGSLDELNGVVLNRIWRRDSSSAGSGDTMWVVSLEFEGWERPVSVFETRREARAYRQFKHLAERLQIDAIDRTGRPVASRLITAPPAASGIDSSIDPQTTSIALPALGFSLGSISLMLLGLPFLGLGGFALLVLGGWTLGPIFLLLGSGLTLAAIVGSYAREVVIEDGDTLIFATSFRGWRYGIRRLPKRAIESVDIRDASVVARSDEQLVRIGGELPHEAQRWLTRTLLTLAGR